METEFKYIDCAGRKFDENEYKCLRDEQNKRVDMAFNHGFSVASIMLVYLAALLVVIYYFCDLAMNEASIIAKDPFVDCIIAAVVIMFCGLPTFLIEPFSVKFSDNIRQIVSIANYILVFYEFPSLISKTDDNNISKNPCKSWELLHCNSKIPQGNRHSLEYVIISTVSLILTIVCSIALLACIIAPHPAYFENAKGYIAVILLGLGVIILLVFLAVYLKRIVKNLKVEKIFEDYGEKYFNCYVEMAVELKLFSSDQSEELKKFCKYKQDKDNKLFNDIN